MIIESHAAYNDLKNNTYYSINRSNELKFHVLAFLIFLSSVTISYVYYKKDFASKKQAILQDNSQIIFNHSFIKFDNMISELPFNHNKKETTIKVKNSDIIVCNKKQCLKKNLFEFSSVLDQYISDYVYYRIDVNKQLVNTNVRVDSYQLERHFPINNYNQLSIYIALDPKYLNKLQQQSAQPFLITIVLSTLCLVLFLISNNQANKIFYSYYSQYFKKAFDSKLKIIIEDYENKILSRENALMKKIWSLEYNKDRDKEFNRFFSQKANQLALFMQEAGNLSPEKYENAKQSPCSIILYNEAAEKEQINAQDLIIDFSERFIDSEDNITITIAHTTEAIEFSSKEFLYQIIYSIINCIIFILKEQQPPTNKHSLSFDISLDKGKLCLSFYYNG